MYVCKSSVQSMYLNRGVVWSKCVWYVGGSPPYLFSAFLHKNKVETYEA